MENPNKLDPVIARILARFGAASPPPERERPEHPYGPAYDGDREPDAVYDVHESERARTDSIVHNVVSLRPDHHVVTVRDAEGRRRRLLTVNGDAARLAAEVERLVRETREEVDTEEKAKADRAPVTQS